MTSRVPLGACLRGFSAMVVMQALGSRLPEMISQLERNPNAHPDCARELRATWADIRMAGWAYLDWRDTEVPQSAAAEVPLGGDGPSLDRPPVIAGLDTGEVAMRLRRSERWVRQLCVSGRLLATKRGGQWWVDSASLQVYLEAEKGAAA